MAGQLEFDIRETPRRVALNVTQLVRLVRDTLDAHVDEYWVSGEVSNARLAPSRHLYFTLKDSRSAISVVMFSSASRKLRFRVIDGSQVVVRGRVSVYEARGTLQFYAEEIEPRGLGALQLAFDQLKQRLNQEGLFDPALKRPLPRLPRTIGLVTALGGAALRDMLRVLLDRYPNLHLIIRPTPVQGPGAAAEIVRALDDLNRDGRAEVIIAGRGGGSLEDLWPFNEEIVARAIRRSRIPVVSAVGHEIDYTIADFAADLRAPTPSAAAQLVVPIKAELRHRVDELGVSLRTCLQTTVAAHRRHLGHLTARLRDPTLLVRQSRQRLDDNSADLGHAIASRIAVARAQVRELQNRVPAPAGKIREQRLILSRLAWRLDASTRAAMSAYRARLAQAAHRLDAVSPLRVLERGYAVAVNVRTGRTLIDAHETEIGDELQIRVARGRIRARTTDREI